MHALMFIAMRAGKQREHVPLGGRISYKLHSPNGPSESWTSFIKKLTSDTAKTKIL
jgi:hypothetical protein